MAAGEGAPTFDVHHNGWKLGIEARPRSKAARGREGYRPVGISPTRGGFVDSASPLRDAAMRKGKKYPEVDLPFIVAVDALDPAGVDRDDAADALFGKEQVTRAAFPDGRLGQPVLTRSRNGLWVDGSGPRYTRISAVLLFNELRPWTCASASLCLYRNPWATSPAPALLQRLPHAIASSGEPIQWIEGASLGAILGLPPDWPGPRD